MPKMILNRELLEAWLEERFIGLSKCVWNTDGIEFEYVEKMPEDENSKVKSLRYANRLLTDYNIHLNGKVEGMQEMIDKLIKNMYEE